MLGNQVGPHVLDLVREWAPLEVYGHERKYQSELQDYLDERLNSDSQGMGFGGPMGGGQETHQVSTERGTAYGDVVVDDAVGIELKRNFSNDQKRKLRGQLEDYADSYPFVIACACGIEDSDGWREVENKFAQRRGGIMDTTEYHFIIKRREHFGQNRRDSGGDGFLGGIF